MSEALANAAPATDSASDSVINDSPEADVRAAIASLQGANSGTAGADDGSDAARADRARNERGQFTRADDTVTTGAVAKPVSDADPGTDKPIQQPSTAAVEPPKTWSADAKAEFATLSPAVQQAVLKREREMDEGGHRWSEEKRRYEETLAPIRAASQRNGVDEREGLNRLVAANDFLERSPAEAIQWLAKAYGVDLGNLNAQPQAQQHADPALSHLWSEVSSLKSNLADRQRREEEAAQRDTVSEIEKFAAAPGHEHFEELKVMMGKLIVAGEAADMQDAYDKAAWATPSVRAKLIASQTAAADANRNRQANVDKARRGAISVSGSPAAGASPSPKKDYDTPLDAVRAAVQQHMG
ncbi:hypothetical protein [Rhizobium sp. BK251]|uniref:hypothetical protein n=1 Tax=Rhizobium sp. BK251 TaxID=2512125 RepID=UPI001045BA25|nr:hypothetical protein [Rhizobium sp. BK251]TCL70542.1 hypothetical protein EV286_107417 [Rhizobium sp. BK251]